METKNPDALCPVMCQTQDITPKRIAATDTPDLLRIEERLAAEHESACGPASWSRDGIGAKRLKRIEKAQLNVRRMLRQRREEEKDDGII